MEIATEKRDASRRVYFTIPAGFDPRSALPRRLWDRADDAMWFVNLVMRKTLAGKTDRHGFARLNRRVLCRVLSERTATPVVRAMVDVGVVERDGHVIGERSSGFRLTPRWLAQPVCRVPATDARLIERVLQELRYHEQLQLARRLPVHDDLDRVQMESLAIGPGADELVASLANASIQQRQRTLLTQIRSGKPARRSYTGRLHSAFSVCMKTMRPLFRLDGEPLAGWDIRCAQPALAAILLGPQITQFVQCVGAYHEQVFSAPDCST